MEKEIIRYTHIPGIAVIEHLPDKFPSHWHDSAEFALILKKGCRFKVAEQVYEPEEQDILLIWPRELHETVRASEDSALLMQVSSAVMENSTDLAAAMRFLNKCRLIQGKKEPELSKKLSGYFSELQEIYENEHYFIETKCKIIVYQILLLIGEYALREYREQIGDAKFSDKAWEYVRKACSFIAEHSEEDISQTEVADAVGLSPYYFSKIFKDYTQTTFPAYLAGIRVQNAIHLLTNEEMAITECAFMAGFQSTTTFNKVFRETTGCSPKEFRKLHLSPVKQSYNRPET